jgi:hypothetical protein
MEPFMKRPQLEPVAAYENLQHAALDYLDHICQLFRTLKRPDDETLRWKDVRDLAGFVAKLAHAAEQIEPLETESA